MLLYHSRPADGVIGLLLCRPERIVPSRFAQEEFSVVDFDQMGFVLGAVIGTVGENCLIFDLRVEALEKLAAAIASVGFEAPLEVSDRFGVGDEFVDALAEKVFETGAVEELLLSGVCIAAVKLLEDEDFEYEQGVEGALAVFFQSLVAKPMSSSSSGWKFSKEMK